MVSEFMKRDIISTELFSSWAFQQGLPQSMWALDDGGCKERLGSQLRGSNVTSLRELD